MLQLPNVTLLVIDTVCHELATRSIAKCVSQADFGDILSYSDQCIWDDSIYIKSIVGLAGYQEFLWYSVPWQLLKTSHALVVHWDSWILDANMWLPAYLDYDYVGASFFGGSPDGYNVGNGGFSLRSKRLMQCLADNREAYPLGYSRPEDFIICREHRRQLEAFGFKWAPENVANVFAFDTRKPSPDSRHFGFHGLFNFSKVMDAEEMECYTRLLKANEYTSMRLRHTEITSNSNVIVDAVKMEVYE
jgi:hypothetical protein